MNNNFRNVYMLVGCFCLLIAISSCSVNKQISRQASKLLLKDTAIRQGHIGISIYEPASGKYWYEHDAEKYFVPASNTKLFSLYAGMKYLGDSLNGFKIYETADSIYFKPNGDPTFLHPDFINQSFFNLLQSSRKKIAYPMDINHRFEALGLGWAWDDYGSGYMAERSSFPIYGNEVTFISNGKTIQSIPSYFLRKCFDEPMIQLLGSDGKFIVSRSKESNKFNFRTKSSEVFKKQEIPFITNYSFFNLELLLDTLGLPYNSMPQYFGNAKKYTNFKTQPSDSLFKPMMHRSDNFFAEQTLLMASNEKLGYMSDGEMIAYLLNTDLKDIPQKPKWVDGSGLSRYNLFTPKSFVYLLNKMKNEFDWERIKNILPTGGEGTLSSYYKTEKGFIYAKTGTLSNNCALSGYLITKNNKLLIFSVLANNYQTGATPVRRAVEEFLKNIREKY